MQTINDRFREVRKMLGKSQDAFASEANRTRSEISNIEYGKTVPKPEVISAVCNAHGIDRTWLETGTGDPFREKSDEERIAEVLGGVLAGSEQSKARLIRAVANLPDELTDAAIQVIRQIAESLQE